MERIGNIMNLGPRGKYQKYGEFRDHRKIWVEMENMEYRENGGNRYILKIMGILNLRNRRDNCPSLIISLFIYIIYINNLLISPNP